MAKEITCGLKVTIASKGGSQSVGVANSAEDLTGSSAGFQVTIGASSASLIDMGDVTSPKVIYIQNNDAANFITVDNVVGLTGWPQKILPGTAVVLRPLDGTLYARANTAPVSAFIVAG